jgi:hypothetical protein
VICLLADVDFTETVMQPAEIGILPAKIMGYIVNN